MKRSIWITKSLGTILIIVGVMAMLLPIFTILYRLYVQGTFLKQNEGSVVAEETELLAADDETTGEQFASSRHVSEQNAVSPYIDLSSYTDQSVNPSVDTNEEDKETVPEPFERSAYKRGMMVINIPKIEVHAAVVEGTTSSLLKLGPGLYEISPLPDAEGGNVCIAGHRTTYGACFRKVNKLEAGDDIYIDFLDKRYTYKVEKVFVVEKDDWSVTEPTGYSALTLTACHPPGSARQRIVVRARLNTIEELVALEPEGE